jgi:hypothetical protein
VFLVASLESDRAAEVLLECEGGCGHLESSKQEGQNASDRTAGGIGTDSFGESVRRPSPSTYSNRMRTADGMARRLDIQPEVDGSLTGGGSDSPQSERIFAATGKAPALDTGRAVPKVFRKSARVTSATTPETCVDDGIANTLNNFDVGDVRTTHAILGGVGEDDPLLPLGLDSHRYRCCGNGVVAPVAEWIGRRIVEADRRWREEDK